ncbi:MAG: SpoIIE family protein phosphatase [SAR324 cluster bacterium]|nr:SpoIIE family protein phosphatase [SAR324 cluster bacterium]
MTVNDQKIFDLLRESRYFEHVSDEEIQEILILAQYREYQSGTVVLDQGSENHDLYFMIKGAVSVIVDGEFIYHLQRKGDIFGEISAITGEFASATIEAFGDLEAFTISSTHLQKIENEPSHNLHHLFYQWFARILADKLKRTTKRAKRYEEMNRKLVQEKEARHTELVQAKETQKSILPKSIPSIPGVRTAFKYVPIDEIGGDFYDIVELEDDQFGILTADVSGHGISAALISFMVSTVFRSAVYDQESPECLLNTVNDLLYEKLPSAKFVTMCYGIYDSAKRLLSYSIGGHLPSLVIRPKTNDIFFLRTAGTVIGQFPSSMVDCEKKTFQCLPGDKVFFYTDGLNEVSNAKKELLGDKKLIKFFEEHSNLPIDQLLEKTYDFALQYSEMQGFQDDMTLIGMEILEE